MPEMEGTCEYILDPDDPGTWGGEEDDECYVDEELLDKEGVWNCPHDAETDGNLCIFHQPIREKDSREAVDALLKSLKEANTVDKPTPSKLQFIGAKFNGIHLGEDTLNITIEGGVLAMEHLEISGAFDLSDSVFDVSTVRLSGLKCAGKTDLSGTEFRAKVYFHGANFKDKIRITNSIFTGSIDFYDSDFNKDLNAEGAEFEKQALFNKTIFRGEAIFCNADFKHKAQFDRAEFEDRTTFRLAKFEGGTIFQNVEFNEDVNFQSDFDEMVTFRDAEFGGFANFLQVRFSQVDFSGSEFKGEAEFTESEFRGDASFGGTVFEGDISFTKAVFRDDVSCENIRLDDAQFDGADLTGASFTGASLCNVNFESALLSRITLLGSDLRGAKLSGAVLGDVRIDYETKFLGHPSDNSETSPHTFSAIRSRPTCVYDPGYEENNEHEDVDKAKSIYRTLEELGGKHARPRLHARAFVRRQDLQKKDYWDDSTANDASLEERFIAGVRWSRAKVARGTLLYGESPWRIITYSLGLILAFGFTYPLGGWVKTTTGVQSPVTYERIAQDPMLLWKSIYHSAMLFATGNRYGGVKAVNFTGEVLTTVEALLGPTLLALLVFVLGRRAAR